MFEQILTSIKTKYKNLGLSEDYLKVIAKRLVRTVKEESEIEDAVADVEDEMKFQQSQNDAIRTLKTQLKKFEEGEVEKGKKGESKKDNEDKGKKEESTEEIPAWAKSIIDSNKAIQEKLAQNETEKINETNEHKLISKLKELGVNENFYRYQITGKTFENDEQIVEFANRIKENEEAYQQAINNTRLGNVEPPKFGGNVKENEVSPEAQAFINAKMKKDESN